MFKVLYVILGNFLIKKYEQQAILGSILVHSALLVALYDPYPLPGTPPSANSRRT